MKVQKGTKGLFLKLVIAFAVFMVIFTCKSNHASAGCYVHRWSSATCTKPKTCAVCGKTEGSALYHLYRAATCTSPKTCTRPGCGDTVGKAKGHTMKGASCTEARHCTTCGYSVGSALGHSWQPATCIQARHCDMCGATDGKPLYHSYTEATCTSPKTCTRCRNTVGSAKGHTMKAASCTEARHCTTCGYSVGSALGHSWQPATCIQARHCDMCGVTEGTPLYHNYAEATCTKPQTCHRCGGTVGSAKGHKMKPASCTEPRHCDECGYSIGEALGHSWLPATCQHGRYCDMCGLEEGDSLPHTFLKATCTDPKKCKVCGTTIGEALGHCMQPATCKRSSYCDICGHKEGDPADHVYGNDGKCIWCGNPKQVNGINADDEGRLYQDHIYVLIDPAAGNINHKYFAIFERTYVESGETVTYGGYVTNSNIIFKEEFPKAVIDLGIQILSNIDNPYVELFVKAVTAVQSVSEYVDAYNAQMAVNRMIDDRYRHLVLKDFEISSSVRNLAILNAYKLGGNSLGANAKENSLYDNSSSSSAINLCSVFGHDYRYIDCEMPGECLCGAKGDVIHHKYEFVGDGLPYKCSLCQDESDTIADDFNNPYLGDLYEEEHEHVWKYGQDSRYLDFYHTDSRKAHYLICDICDEVKIEAHDFIGVERNNSRHVLTCTKCHAVIDNEPCTDFEATRYTLMVNTNSDADRMYYGIRERRCRECGGIESYAAYIDFDMQKKREFYGTGTITSWAIDNIIMPQMEKMKNGVEVANDVVGTIDSAVSAIQDITDIINLWNYMNVNYSSLLEQSGIVVYNTEEFQSKEPTMFTIFSDFADEYHESLIR